MFKSLRVTYLLHEHDDFRRDQRAAVAGHHDQLHHLVLAQLHRRLCLQQRVHVVYVSGGLELGVPQPAHGLIRLVIAALAHVPTGRFGTEEDEYADDDGREHGRSHHETPVEADDAGLVRHFEKRQIGRVSEHDAKGRPHLPLHDEGTSDRRRT